MNILKKEAAKLEILNPQYEIDQKDKKREKSFIISLILPKMANAVYMSSQELFEDYGNKIVEYLTAKIEEEFHYVDLTEYDCLAIAHIRQYESLINYTWKTYSNYFFCDVETSSLKMPGLQEKVKIETYALGAYIESSTSLFKLIKTYFCELKKYLADDNFIVIRKPPELKIMVDSGKLLWYVRSRLGVIKNNEIL